MKTNNIQNNNIQNNKIQNNKINTDLTIYKFNKKMTHGGIICIIVVCILFYLFYKYKCTI